MNNKFDYGRMVQFLGQFRPQGNGNAWGLMNRFGPQGTGQWPMGFQGAPAASQGYSSAMTNPFPNPGGQRPALPQQRPFSLGGTPPAPAPMQSQPMGQPNVGMNQPHMGMNPINPAGNMRGWAKPNKGGF